MSYPYIELDLQKIEQLGERRENENIRFRTFLKGKDPDRIDPMVNRLNEEISARIDCTKCANCCKKLAPCISETDIEKLSQRLALPAEKIKNDYLESDDGDDFFKHLPCSFLKENKCSVYEDRPEDCASYPHLHKPDVISRLWGILGNYSVCPIVYNVVEQLKMKLHFRS